MILSNKIVFINYSCYFLFVWLWCNNQNSIPLWYLQNVNYKNIQLCLHDLELNYCCNNMKQKLHWVWEDVLENILIFSNNLCCYFFIWIWLRNDILIPLGSLFFFSRYFQSFLDEQELHYCFNQMNQKFHELWHEVLSKKILFIKQLCYYFLNF